jgi:hypothetical protein
MANHQGIELFSYNSCGTVNGLWARNLKNGKWTVFLVSRSSGSDPLDGHRYFWQEGLRTPKEFVEACLGCLAEADFGKADITDIHHLGGEQLRKLDKKFARELKRWILGEHGKEKIGKYPSGRSIDSPRGVGRGNKPIKGRVYIGEGLQGATLTRLETLRQYGASLSFVGSFGGPRATTNPVAAPPAAPPNPPDATIAPAPADAAKIPETNPDPP